MAYHDNMKSVGTIYENQDDHVKRKKSDVTGKKTEVDKLEEALEGSHNILFRCKSVFPFDLFPDELIIDENKIDVRHGLFFASTLSTSIPYTKIVKASSTTGLFFATLQIEMEVFIQQPEPINFLWREDAIKARRIINGLVAANKQGIDFRELDMKKATDEFEEIGRASINPNQVG